MTSRYYDASVTEDAVRLLSNPLHSDHATADEHQCLEDREHNSGLNYYPPCNNNDSDNLAGVGIYCNHLTPKYPHNSRLRLICVMSLCLIFMGAEIIGGYIAGSLAIITDGVHLITDLIGFLISFIALTSSRRKSTKRFNFGFYRVEIVSTLVSILLIWIMTGIFVYIAVMRLFRNDYEIEVDLMILVSSFGVVINIVMFLVLHGGCQRKHMHGHLFELHGYEEHDQNINVRAAIIHVLGDLVQSVGVFMSSLIIKFYPNAKFMDPVCTFLFSLIVICSTLKLVKDSVYIIMEAFPNNMNYNSILLNLKDLNGVRHVHNLCVWSLTVETNALTVHLVIDDTADPEQVLCQAQKLIRKKFNITFHTIQIERIRSVCVNFRDDCKSTWS